MSRIKQISGIIPKHSSVKDKMPTAAQLETAEIAVNINTDSPFISVKCDDGSVKKITADGGYVVVDTLPASGKSGVIYALETVAVDPDEGTTYYSYDLYIYSESQWHKIGETTEPLTAGENITIVNNKINADQVIDITQQDYDELVAASAVSETALYNIVDAPVLNTDEYQKKLVAGDFISIDAIHNTIDCTLNPNLYIIVDALPAEGVENKIYLLKVVNPDTTVSFNQYGWINDEWVEYGATSSLQPNIAGSGITIDSNNAINAKLGAGLTMDANSAITADLGAGLKIDSGKIAPNYAAPLILNASNQLSVSSSSTYTSTGTEMFTRAGAYDLYNSFGKEVTVTYDVEPSAVTAVQSVKAFKVIPNIPLYYISIGLTPVATDAGTERTSLRNLTIDGRRPDTAQSITNGRQALAGVNRSNTGTVGVLYRYDGTLYLSPSRNIGSSDNYIINGFVYLPSTAS